jgi:hypothetical protein
MTVLVESVIFAIDPADLLLLENVERNTHNNVWRAAVKIEEVLKSAVAKQLGAFGLTSRIEVKHIGDELRCADPVQDDMEYTHNLDE